MEEAGDLRRRFGRLVAAHRRRAGLTQEGLAAAADLSADMIGRIEGGQAGVRFPSIERLAAALGVDPAELFTTELSTDVSRSKPLLALHARLAGLPERDLIWIERLLDAAMKPRS